MKNSLLVIVGIILLTGISFFILQNKPNTQPIKPQEEQRLLNEPDSAQKYTDLTNYYINQHQYADAEQAANKLIQLEPVNEMAYLRLGNILFRFRKNYTEAERNIRKAMELAPADDWPHIELGNSDHDQGKLAEAEAEYRKAIELNPKRNWGYKELGRLMLQKGDEKQAETLFLKAIEVEPNTPDPDNAYKDLVALYRKQGRNDEADSLEKRAPKN